MSFHPKRTSSSDYIPQLLVRPVSPVGSLTPFRTPECRVRLTPPVGMSLSRTTVSGIFSPLPRYPSFSDPPHSFYRYVPSPVRTPQSRVRPTFPKSVFSQRVVPLSLGFARLFCSCTLSTQPFNQCHYSFILIIPPDQGIRIFLLCLCLSLS